MTEKCWRKHWNVWFWFLPQFLEWSQSPETQELLQSIFTALCSGMHQGFPKGMSPTLSDPRGRSGVGLALIHILQLCVVGICVLFRGQSGAVPLFQLVRSFSAELKDRTEAFSGHSHPRQLCPGVFWNYKHILTLDVIACMCGFSLSWSCSPCLKRPGRVAPSLIS